MNKAQKPASPALMVIVAFTIVYIVWGSTYFFIKLAIVSFPPLLMGAFRFSVAGALLLLWCALRGEKIFDAKQIKHAAISGVLLLFIGNGAVIWTEQYLPSSLVAVLVSAAPIWFVVLDKPNWGENFSSKTTLTGLLIGFCGVVLLFSGQLSKNLGSAGSSPVKLIWLLIIVAGSVAWAGGSLYSKHSTAQHSSLSVTAAWQMLAGGAAFLIAAAAGSELKGFHWQQVTTGSWLAILYLVIMGSLVAYSAYVWLLQVRTATQVSTYAYVNPVVAVVLGVLFAGEKMSAMQIAGLVIILVSVLLINLHKYRKEKKEVKLKQLATA